MKRLPASRTALLSALLCWLLPLACLAQAPSLTLTTDTAVVPVYSLVNLTASVQGTTPATGSITFLDGGSPIATLPLNSQAVAVLGIASLASGTHILSATYSGDGANAGSSSAPVTVLITALAAPFTLAANSATVYVNGPVNLSAIGLPASATGSVVFTEGSATLANLPVRGGSTPRYNAFGDAITLGQMAGPGQDYPDLFAVSYGFTVSNYAEASAVSCDVLPFELLQNGVGPTQTSAPLTSLMIGTNEINAYQNRSGAQAYLPTFHACEQAALTWLAIPREYKVLAGDPGATITSGVWTSTPGAFDANFGTLLNTTGSGVAQFSLTSNGGPIYLWYLLGDTLPGTFTLTIDGVPSATTYSTQPSPAISSLAHPQSIGYALARFAVGAGPHTFGVNVQSGTVGILGLGTPPSAGAASVHPTLLVSDIPNQLTSNPLASPALLAAYTQDIQATVGQLAGDGLEVRLVPTESFLLGSANEMADQVSPSALGQSHLAQAFASVFQNAATAPYAAFSGTNTTSALTFGAPGTHIVTASYSGDGVFATSSAAPVTVTVLPQTITSTSLFTQTTNYPYRAPVLLTGTVAPAAATGTLTFFDGTAYLGQATLVNGSASITAGSLAPGVHGLTVQYSGDLPDAPSASPALLLQINPAGSAVSLAALPATAPYGTLAAISASVTPASATGTISFTDSVFGSLGQVTVVGGTASVSVAALAPGAHSITAVYSGDAENLAATSATLSTTITALATSTTIAGPSAPAAYGAAVLLTAAVLPASATGSVSFIDSLAGTLGAGTLLNGVASFVSATLTPGTHTVRARYNGDLADAPSISPVATLTVEAPVAGVTLAPLATTLYAGSPLSLVAAVTPASATGTVTFRDANLGTLGQSTVAQGSATLVLGALAPGAYSISASYSGDAKNALANSTAVLTQVLLNPTSTTLMAPASSNAYATVITLTAKVSPATAGGLTQPGGVVQFFDGATSVGQAPILNGMASRQLTTLSVGSHALHATYAGDSLNASSSSMPVSILITPNNTSTSLSVAQAIVPVGSPVTFNIRVTASVGWIPTGTVAIRSGSRVLVSGALANSAPGIAYATLSVDAAALGIGGFPVAAFYSGDANDAASDSAGISTSFTVVGTATATSLTLSATQVPPQTPVVLSASTVANTLAIGTGTVTFLGNGRALGTVPLSASGSATLSLATLPVGVYSISASYNPGGLFAASATAAETLFVTPPLALALSPAGMSAAPGSTQSTALTLTPLSGFSGAISSVCSTSASFLTCTIDAPGTISSPATATLHLAVAQDTAANVPPVAARTTTRLAVACVLLLPLLAPRKAYRHQLGSVLALLLLTVFAGCAEGGNFFAVPAGPQTVSVTVHAAGTDVTVAMVVHITH